MADEFLEIIKAANSEIQEFLEVAVRNASGGAASPELLQSLGTLDARLKQVGEHLGEASTLSRKSPDAAEQLRTYGGNLVSVRRIVEKLQRTLLTERARLDHVRTNLKAASNWADSTRELS